MQINWQKLNIPIIGLHLLILIHFMACNARENQPTITSNTDTAIVVGAARFDQYLHLLQSKQVGMVVNHSSMVGDTHLTDTLLSQGITITKIFAPEHGFRGDLANGETVEDGTDKKTGLPIISLYGKNKKPDSVMLSGLDIMVFDMQDVGTRFFTYLSTMHYVMEACAEHKVPLIILDRPNPNGYYIDGPVMQKEHQSFIGMHPIPIVHGMTLGELAQMINGEQWLANAAQAEIKVVPVLNYDHNSRYQLPVRPSPNLPNQKAVNLYPSLCLFEQTIMSVGRGTDHPFTCYGHPAYPDTTFAFLPQSRTESVYPKHEGVQCYGVDLSGEPDLNRFELKYLIHAYEAMSGYEDVFFKKYFARLAGNEHLAKQIIQGTPEQEIRQSWKQELEEFKKKRKKYLLYTDFE